MHLEIFNVEHGACALITTSNGRRAMIDCGHNATTGWRPGDALRARGIDRLDRLFVTNYDEDHVSGYPNLVERVQVHSLTRNWRVPAAAIRRLKSEHGMGLGIERFVEGVERTFTGGPPGPVDLDFGDTSFAFFANPLGPPGFGFDDENNLSLVVFVTCGTHRVVFPGDLEVAGWRALLRDPHFASYLGGVRVFVASHHGRQNGYCREVLDLCPMVEVVVISDCKMKFQSQEVADLYRAHARGVIFNGKHRRVLTTRRDGYMRFEFSPSGGATILLESGGA